MNVAMIDLLTQTPFYDRYLAEAIVPLVDEFILYAPRFHYEPGYFDDAAFNRSPGLVDWVSGLRLHVRPLRRTGKIIEYALNWLFLLHQFHTLPPDVVHIQWLPLLSQGQWELRVVERIRHLGLPVVYTVHNYLPHEVGSTSRQTFQKVYHSADHLAVHTQKDQERLMEDCGITGAKITVIPHGPLFFEQSNFAQERARQYLGLNRDDFVFLMLGVIRPYKGIAETIEALSRVVKMDSKCKLVLAGNALDRKYLERLKILTDRLAVQSNIRWHVGYIPTAQVGLFHAAADVVLFPYRNISQSGAFLTAAGLGKCTLTTQIAGLAEIVQDDNMGVQITSVDPVTIADGLLRCIELPPEDRERMGKTLQSYVTRYCNWDLIAQQTVKVYNELLSQKL